MSRLLNVFCYVCCIDTALAHPAFIMRHQASMRTFVRSIKHSYSVTNNQKLAKIPKVLRVKTATKQPNEWYDMIIYLYGGWCSVLCCLGLFLTLGIVQL